MMYYINSGKFMTPVSGLSSDPFGASSMFPIITGIGAVGLGGILLHRCYVHNKKTQLRNYVTPKFGFQSFHGISATPEELSEIGKIRKIDFPDYIYQENRTVIARGKSFRNPTLPLPVDRTINRLAQEIMQKTGSSSIEMSLIGKNQNDKITHWHIDGMFAGGLLPRRIRFLCTLRSPTTRFARLSFEERSQFRKIYIEKYRTFKNGESEETSLARDAQIAKELKIGPKNIFSPKLGEVIAFSEDDEYGAVHARPLSSSSDRLLLMFHVDEVVQNHPFIGIS